jgi:D-alanine-D-alanine ligase
VFVLEVNTLPGLTPTSLLPNSAAHGGIDFDELCRSIVMEAIGIDASKT